MRRPLHFHPGPLTILVAIVLCLLASLAFGQVGKLSPGPAAAPPALVNVLPSASGLTSGAAPGLTAGTPSASGLTSGSAPALPPGLATTGTTPSTTADTTATSSGGSTRGVVPLVMPSFEDMDTNHDGVISRSEYERSVR